MQKPKAGEVCRLCGMRVIKGDGRHLSLNDAQIREVLRHFAAPYPKLSQKEFCQQAGVGLGIYDRVTHSRSRIKNDKDVARVDILAVELGLSWDEVREKWQ